MIDEVVEDVDDDVPRIHSHAFPDQTGVPLQLFGGWIYVVPDGQVSVL